MRPQHSLGWGSRLQVLGHCPHATRGRTLSLLLCALHVHAHSRAPPAQSILDLRNERFCESAGDEAKWLWDTMHSMRREVPESTSDSRKLFFVDYHLRGTRVCKYAWHKMAGWPCEWREKDRLRTRLPGRTQRYEGLLEAGDDEFPDRSVRERDRGEPAGNKSDITDQWIAQYFELVCDSSPTARGAAEGFHGVAYYPPVRPGFCFMLYRDDIAVDRQVGRKWFNKRMRMRLKKGIVVDEANQTRFQLKPRDIRARGFKKCALCENFDEQMREVSRYRTGVTPAERKR